MAGVSTSWLAQRLKVHETIIEGWIKKGLLETLSVEKTRYIMADVEGEESERVTVLLSFPVEPKNAETEKGPGPCQIIKFDKVKARR